MNQITVRWLVLVLIILAVDGFGSTKRKREEELEDDDLSDELTEEEIKRALEKMNNGSVKLNDTKDMRYKYNPDDYKDCFNLEEYLAEKEKKKGSCCVM